MKDIDLSALDDLEGGLLLSPVGARSVTQDSFETNECRRKEGRRESLLRCSWWSKGLGVGVKACLKAASEPRAG